MYTFDGGFSNYPYLNFTENVLHITPNMWKNLNGDDIDIKNSALNSKETFLNSFTSLNIILELFLMVKNRNYMELFDNGYLDAKNNKELLDKIFLETDTVEKAEKVKVDNADKSNYYKITNDYDSDNDNNYMIDFYSKDNDSY
jgi:hypothetical protein